VHTKFWSESLNGGDHSGDLGVYRKIILEWILEEWGGGGVCGLGLCSFLCLTETTLETDHTEESYI
jgi:hypothetical protein